VASDRELKERLGICFGKTSRLSSGYETLGRLERLEWLQLNVRKRLNVLFGFETFCTVDVKAKTTNPFRLSEVDCVLFKLLPDLCDHRFLALTFAGSFMELDP